MMPKEYLELLVSGSPVLILVAIIVALVWWILYIEKERKLERSEFKAADAAEREKLMLVIESSTEAITRMLMAADRCMIKGGRDK